MVEKLNAGSVDMGKLMPYHVRRFLAQRFAESVEELGKVALAFMNVEDDVSGESVGKLFVLSDGDDFQISYLQRRVDWIKLEFCYSYGREILGDISVVAPDHLLKLRERQSVKHHPVVCIADYSGDDYYRHWTRSLNGALN